MPALCIPSCLHTHTHTHTPRRYIQDYVVQPLMADLARIVHSCTPLALEDFSEIHWPVSSDMVEDRTGGCFLWSMDQRLHHMFVRSFVAREFCKQILDAGMDSPTGSFDLGILSKAVASLSYHLGTNSGRVSVYFKSTGVCDSQFSMVLCTHKDVSCLRRFWRFCPLLALLFFSEL